MTAPAEAPPVPLMISARSATLFGLLYEPTHPSGVAAIVLGYENVGLGRSRILARLARRVVAGGMTTFRFDTRGTGESSGGAYQAEAIRPFVDDLVAVAEVLRRRGYDRIVMVGHCGGARTMLAAADRVRGLEAMALLSVVPRAKRTWAADRLTTRALLRLALRPAAWRALLRRQKQRGVTDVIRAVAYTRRVQARRRRADPSRATADYPLDRPFVDGLGAVARRRLPVLLLYGDEDSVLTDLRDAHDPKLNDLLRHGASSIDFRVIPGDLHTQQQADVVDAAIEITAEFVARAVSPEAATAADSLGSPATADRHA